MNTENLKNKLNIAHAVTAFLISAAFYIVLIAVCRVTPFGDKTWLAYDMKRQYVDFFSYFKSVLGGNNNVLYSLNASLGSGTIGFFAYYLTSPFLFLIALFPVNRFALAVSVVIGLKLALSAATFDCMLQKLCGKSAYICSVSFAFASFMMSNAMNIMWLDVLIFLPIVIIMTEKLLHEGKLLGYTASVAIILYLNYYIAYMVLLFVIVWSVSRLWATRNKEFQEAILRLGIATGAGAGIDAFILLPTFLELRNSPKDVMLEGMELKGSNLYPYQLLSKLLSLSYDGAEVYWGKPLIFCGILMMVLTVLYFVNNKIPRRERISMAFILIVMAVSFAFDSVNLIWHAGMEPSGYPYRQAMMCVLILLICSCRSIQELKSGITYPRIFAAFAVVLAILIYLFIRHEPCLDGWKMYYSAALIVLCMVLIVLYVRNYGNKFGLLFAALFMFVQLADLGINDVYIYRIESVLSEDESDFCQIIGKTEEAVNSVKNIDSTFYRMENLTPREINDAMMHDYMGVTHYSSAGLMYVRAFLQKMGYNDDSLYIDYGHDNTETADSLLGIKYLMADSSSDIPVHKDYEMISDGAYRVYRNPYALPAAVGVYREMSGESIDPFTLQEDIYSRLAGEPVSLFIPADVQVAESDSGRAVMEYRVIVKAPGEMYFYMSDLIGMHSNLEIYINDEFLTYYGNDSCLKVLDLGYFEEGDYLIMHVIAYDEGEFGNAMFMTEDTDALRAAYDKTKDRQAMVTRLSSSRLAMTLDSAYTVGDDISDEVGVFTTIPYQKGWKVKVAGVKVEPLEVYDALMYIPLTEALQQAELGPGQKIRIEMYFVSEGLYLGIVVSIMSLAVIILMASIRKGEAGFFGDDYDDEDSLDIIEEYENADEVRP